MRLWKRKAHHPVDDPLFHWPDGSPFSVRHMLRSVETKGISGSGKSSATLQHFLECLAAHPRATITMITQKPEEKEQVQDIFARAGRRDDLLVIEPGGEYRCNFFEDELASGADTRALVEFITVLGEGLQVQGGGRENDRFFRMSEDRFNYNAVAALALGSTVTAPNLLEFFTTAAYDGETLADPERYAQWKEKLHFRVMKQAEASRKTPAQANDWKVLKPFWETEFTHMDDKPRSSILAGVMNTLHAAITGLAGEMTSTFTNIRPSVIDEGKSLLIDLPYSMYGPTGRYVAGGMKYKVQKHILRRQWNPAGYFNVLILDEFQESVTEFDASYLAQCRSHGGCMLCLTQTVHSEYGRMGGHAGHHKADMLLSNYGTHIYHLCDPGTAEAASKLLGQRKEAFATIPGGGELWESVMGHSQLSVNFQYTPILQPALLMNALRTGGPAHQFCVDGVVIRPGEPFRNRENYQFVTFKQRV